MTESDCVHTIHTSGAAVVGEINALVDAEMASLLNSPDAFKLYDVAVK